MDELSSDEAGRTVQTARTTFRVLDAVTTREQAGVTELAEALELSKSAVHRHLTTLVAEGRVEKRDGEYRRSLRDTEGVSVAFAVVEALKELQSATAEEIAAAVGRSTATVSHYLSWLESEGYITRQGEEYQNGLRFLDIGERVKHGTGIFDIAAEQVDDLAAECGELVLMSLLEHGQNVLLYKSHGPDAIQTSHEIGLREPLHCSGLGKAILSELPRERVERIVDEHGLPAFTEHTITDREELFAELDRTRERGYAIDDEEAKPGIRCIAAPVVIGDGDLYGAVSVTAPQSRMRNERFEETLPELVTGAANVIEVNSIYL
jgi:DNA-binding IclR family transcriptional regulator